MSAVPVTTDLAHGPAPTHHPSGAALAQDFKQTYGEGEQSAAEGQAHYNRITKKWEGPDEHVVSSKQDGSTFPEDVGDHIHKPTFREQVMGNAKKFAGKTFGKQHEVVVGEALLQGQGKDQALAAGEAAKR